MIYFLVNVILNFKYCEIKDCTDYAHRTEFAKIFHYILYGVEVITLIIFLTVKIKRIMSTKNKKIMFLKIIKYLIIIFLIHFCIMHLHGIVELIKRCGEDWSYPYHWDSASDDRHPSRLMYNQGLLCPLSPIPSWGTCNRDNPCYWV